MKTQSNSDKLAKHRTGVDPNQPYKNLVRELNLTTKQAKRLVNQTEK